MRYKYKEIKLSLSKKKNNRSSLWVRFWVRKFSFPVTYLFINSGWSANMVSILSWIVIFIAALLLCVNNFLCMLLGVVLTNFWLVLDCVDGNIARVKKTKTLMGDFYDAIAGYGPFSFTMLAIGMAAYNTTFIFSQEYRFLFVFIGALAAISNIYMRLIHQKYMNCYFVGKKKLNELDDITLKDTEDKKSFSYIREQIDKNIGVSGLFMPWLIIALVTNTFDIMIIFYFLYSFVSFLTISFVYSKKATNFEKYAQEKLQHIEEGKK